MVDALIQKELFSTKLNELPNYANIRGSEWIFLQALTRSIHLSFVEGKFSFAKVVPIGPTYLWPEIVNPESQARQAKTIYLCALSKTIIFGSCLP